MTHEIGHWLGLYHTFQGGCTPPGDFVDDTPYQASPYDAKPWFGCAFQRDTCPTMPGNDPTCVPQFFYYYYWIDNSLSAIDNFMDYSDDVCISQFTPGQTQRMLTALVQFRGVR